MTDIQLNRKNALFVALSLYLLTVIILLSASLLLNHGVFVYALDDTYIHMTIAKNFVLHGTWATNGLNFTSASSSPLWTLIISFVYFLFGVNVITPFLLNILFGILTLLIVNNILKKNNIDRIRLFVLIVVIYVTPMPTILFTGMEHTAQIAITLLFIYLSSMILDSDNNDLRILIYLFLITPFVTAIRNVFCNCRMYAINF